MFIWCIEYDLIRKLRVYLCLNACVCVTVNSEWLCCICINYIVQLNAYEQHQKSAKIASVMRIWWWNNTERALIKHSTQNLVNIYEKFNARITHAKIIQKQPKENGIGCWLWYVMEKREREIEREIDIFRERPREANWRLECGPIEVVSDCNLSEWQLICIYIVKNQLPADQLKCICKRHRILLIQFLCFLLEKNLDLIAKWGNENSYFNHYIDSQNIFQCNFFFISLTIIRNTSVNVMWSQCLN